MIIFNKKKSFNKKNYFLLIVFFLLSFIFGAVFHDAKVFFQIKKILFEKYELSLRPILLDITFVFLFPHTIKSVGPSKLIL